MIFIKFLMPSLEKADLDFQSNAYLILAKYLLKILKLNFDLCHNLSILLPRDSLDSQLGAHLFELNDFIHFLNKEFCGNSNDQGKVGLEF